MPNRLRNRSSATASARVTRRSRGSKQFRSLRIESLESRRLFAVDWRNPVDSLDVDGSGLIVSLDALEIINRLNSNESNSLPAQRGPGQPYWDVTGDQLVAPIDALHVINHLNMVGGGERRLVEGAQFASQAEVTITLGQNSGSRTVRIGLTAEFDTTDTQPALKDQLAVYLVDAANSNNTLLDRGQPGTAFFNWSEQQAELPPGGVRWDGEVLEIDTSSIHDRDTRVLRVQLLNSDTDLGTRITI